MSWSKTLTSAKVSDAENIDTTANLPAFSATAAIATMELEQWRFAVRTAVEIIQRKLVGEGSTFTVALSGTSTAGHPTNDTMTITVTNAN